MTDSERSDRSSDWDSLFQELGLEPPTPPAAPALPPAPVPEALPVAPAPLPAPVAESRPARGARRRRDEDDAASDPAPEETALPFEEPESLFTTAAEDMPEEVDEPADAVAAADDEPLGDEPGEPAPEAPRNGDTPTERTGRRRRRRRRRKGGGEGAPTAAPAVPAADFETDTGEGDDEADAPPEVLEDSNDDAEAEEKPAVPAALDEELDAEAAEPLPQWNVMSWTDLIATLYRPER